MATTPTIPLFKVYMNPTVGDAVNKVLYSGYIGEGDQVKEFESNLGSYFNRQSNVSSIVTCNSATSAEHMIYNMLKKPSKLTTYYEYAATLKEWPGLDENSEVISTPLTCTATNWPIFHNGLKLVWADIDPTTMNICLDSVKEKITEHTRLITIVHWGGYPVDLDRLNKIVRKAEDTYGTKILIIEDCAHAFGSLYKGYNVGFTGNLATFSTQAIKHITTVDGGFLVSPFHEFTERAKLVRWYGIDRDLPRTDFRCEQDIPEIGFKFHMNNVNAAVGIENLKMANGIISTHKINGETYNSKLVNIPGLTQLENSPKAESAYWLYTIRVEDRHNFMKKLSAAGIASSRVHERNDKHSGLTEYEKAGRLITSELPNLDIVCNDMVCIPVGWWVSPKEIDYIINTIKSGW